MRPHLCVMYTLVLLALITALLQLGPIYWAGGGNLVAIGAALPASIGTALVSRRAPLFLAAVGLLIGILSTPAMFIFLFTTGPVALMLGLLCKRTFWCGAIYGAVALFVGVSAMPLLAHIELMGTMEQRWPIILRLGAYALFAFANATMWRAALDRIWRRTGGAIRYTKGA